MLKKSGDIGKINGMDEGEVGARVFFDNPAFNEKHSRLKTSLNNTANRLLLIEKSWRMMNRKAFVQELMHMIKKIHSLEEEVEGIEDPVTRAMCYDCIDKLASQRRFLLEEIRWDLKSSENMYACNNV